MFENVPVTVEVINISKNDIEFLDLSMFSNLKEIRAHSNELQFVENLPETLEYIDFSQNQFFQIVQLKWVLISELLRSNYKYIIYSDVDVVWINNPIPGLEAFFNKNSNIDIQIQSFTHAPEKVRLCMGFIAIRNCKNVTDFISICRKNCC